MSEAKLLESQVDKRLEDQGRFTTVDKLPKDWLSYDVQRKQNEISSPSENAVKLAFTYHKRDITAGDRELRDKEPEILTKGLQKELVAENTVMPDELAKMIEEHKLTKKKRNKLI